MPEQSAEDSSTHEEPEGGEEDIVDEGEGSEIQECDRQGTQPRSVEGMAEDIRRTTPHKRMQVLSPTALAERSKKLPPTCKSHIEQLTVQQAPPPPPTAQSITLKPPFPC